MTGHEDAAGGVVCLDTGCFCKIVRHNHRASFLSPACLRGRRRRRPAPPLRFEPLKSKDAKSSAAASSPTSPAAASGDSRNRPRSSAACSATATGRTFPDVSRRHFPLSLAPRRRPSRCHGRPAGFPTPPAPRHQQLTSISAPARPRTVRARRSSFTAAAAVAGQLRRPGARKARTQGLHPEPFLQFFATSFTPPCSPMPECRPTATMEGGRRRPRPPTSLLPAPFLLGRAQEHELAEIVGRFKRSCSIKKANGLKGKSYLCNIHSSQYITCRSN